MSTSERLVNPPFFYDGRGKASAAVKNRASMAKKQIVSAAARKCIGANPYLTLTENTVILEWKRALKR
ncbi:hypothetical protein QUF79_19585 [Fictibacillus enclensis]|uniref:hypothetical protein n=1 Tax=Fictibacillus enclensis TaxID=1017270 RepID=UPI0025A028FB|nr:hypothetical protein [Fictibacillus enclensis]MDM5200218.1 hypothetical protein [Fictibacillus enclensis]